MSKCIYCERNNLLTNEHVLPRWLYQYTQNQNIQLLQASPDKFLKVQQTIKDVCQQCNNGVLSELDTYAKGRYENFFSNYVFKDQTVTFEYEYDLLARWLLKVSFNSARANGGDHESFLEYREYILTGENRPTRMTIFLQLITPYIFSEKDKRKVKDESLKALGYLPPNFTRISRLDETVSIGINKDNYNLIRMVMLNSYNFYILIPSENIKSREDWKNELRVFKSTELAKGVYKLLPENKSISLSASNVSILDAVKHHLKSNEDVYKKLL